MTDIWAEKPEPRSSPVMDIIGLSSYDNPEMDAWLEKLKEHCDYYENLAAEFAELYANAQEKAEKLRKVEDDLNIMTTNYTGMVRIMEDWKRGAERLNQKLEAIKTHRENFRHSSYIEWLRELDTLLEAEG